MGLRKKILVGYFMIILVPSAFLGMFVYKQFYNSMINEYAEQKQQIINEYYVSMERDLLKIEDIYGLFQYNTYLTDYLGGNYVLGMDIVYSFSKYIKQFYGYLYASMPFVKDIKIYKENQNVVYIPSIIVNMDTFDNNKDTLDRINSKAGIWTCQISDKGSYPDIKYYRKIYDYNLYKELGILEIQTDSEVMSKYMKNIKSISKGNDEIYLLDSNNNVMYRVGKNIFKGDKSSLVDVIKNNSTSGEFSVKLGGKKVIANVIYIKELNIKTIVFEYEKDAYNYMNIKKGTILLYIVILFFVLSVIYYFITTNITARLLKLARHMRNIGEKNISLYKGNSGKDEIGFLIDSYNSMIMRIDDLVNTVHKEELLRKEAAYAALQAQIEPHFLFGTLESIRMLAETNKDFEVSNIIFTLGRLMRYSLSFSKNEVSLREEIENVKSYLEIQKVRMGERLQFEFHIECEIDGFLCPRFIIQPVVENSIVHGISKCRNGGLINISVTEDKEYINVTIFDNGYGISPEVLSEVQKVLDNKIELRDFQTESSGFGVYSVSERIKSYYGKNSRLTLTSKHNEGTTCTLYLYKYRGDVKNENNDC